METRQFEKRFALLIDADNVSAKYLKPIMDELSKYGTVTYKRIYGDWTLAMHSKWKSALLENSITPIQQFGYTQGKNATDSAMIIDAMDILYTHSVEGFCIVSSDSDFTRLAARIRESGLTVIGMGEQKTPAPFRRACDIFTTLELLAGEKAGRHRGAGARGGQAGSAEGTSDAVSIATKEEIETAVVDIITDNQNNGKATGLGEVGSRLLKRYPDFDVRSYGTNLLSKLLDDFSRVKITKDGSNVTVELAEAFSAGGSDAEVSPAASATTAATAAPAVSAEASGASAVGGDASGEETKSKRSRRRRKIKVSAAKAEAGASSAEGEGEAPAVESEPAAVPEAAAAAESEPAAVPELAVAVEAAEPAATPETVAKPRQTRRRKARQTPSPASQAPAPDVPDVPEAPEASAVASPEAPEASGAPEAFIRREVARAGAEGVDLNELGRRVRTAFKSFKVRELGYRHLRAYVSAMDGIAVERRSEGFVALSE